MYQYNTKDVCSKVINFNVEDNRIKDVSFIGGCDGNLKAISKLVDGMDIDQVIEILEGTTCGMRSTSCSDQLTKALIEYKKI